LHYLKFLSKIQFMRNSIKLHVSASDLTLCVVCNNNLYKYSRLDLELTTGFQIQFDLRVLINSTPRGDLKNNSTPKQRKING